MRSIYIPIVPWRNVRIFYRFMLLSVRMLSRDKINVIDAKANTILEDVYGAVEKATIPVRLDKILEHYNINISNGEFEDNAVSGAFVRKEKDIYVANDEPANRQTFTVAHELGHYFLHQEKDTDIFYRTQMLNIDAEDKDEEQEANWFAASILMPESKLHHYYTLTKDLGKLATIFGVSSIAVYYRLKNLGLTI
jgi:Zn-dependent peptidase ImmA (M78 family)